MARAVEQAGDEDDELPSVDDEYQGLGKNARESSSNRRYEALSRDVSARKVVPTSATPGKRVERDTQHSVDKDGKQQQRIIGTAYAAVRKDGGS